MPTQPRRRILHIVLLIILVLVVGLLVGIYMGTRSLPEIQQFAELPPEQRAAAAQRAEDELVRTREIAIASVTAAAPTAPGVEVVTLTQDELNSVFDKWSDINGWTRSYERFITNPTLILRKDRLILAGRLKEMNGTVASLHFEPRVAEGQLDLGFKHMAAGQLPLPTSMYDKHLGAMTATLRSKLPNWQRTAEISPAGTANRSAVAAGLAKLMLSALDRQPAEPYVYLPLVSEPGGVPMKIVDMQVEDGKIALHVQPPTPAERANIIVGLRE